MNYFEFACFNQQRYVPVVVLYFFFILLELPKRSAIDRVLYLPHSTRTAVFAFMAKL